MYGINAFCDHNIFVILFLMVSVHSISPRLLVESDVTSNTSYTGFFRHLLSLNKTTICDHVDMTDSYQLILVILWTANLLLVFCSNNFTCVLLFLLLSVYDGMCVLSRLNKAMMMMMVDITGFFLVGFYFRRLSAMSNGVGLLQKSEINYTQWLK